MTVDFNAMSPAELRDYAAEHGVDTSGIDSRRKAQLVGLLSAHARGETYVPPEPAEPVVASSPGEPAVTTGPPLEQRLGTSGSGSLSAVVADPSADPSAGDERDGLPDLADREPLTLDDLVDGNRVRVAVNVFPVRVDGKDKCRLVVARVPGEDGVEAVAWWRNSQHGPQLQAGVQRLRSRYTDSDRRTVLVTADGGVHVYERDPGCTTCGNRLANWRPWPHWVRVVQVPAL